MFSPKPKQCFRVGVLSSPLYCLGCLDFPPGPGPSPPPTNQGRERRGCRGHLGAGPWRRAAVQGSSSATLTYRPGHPDFKRAGRRQRGLGRAFLPTSRRSARALSLSLSRQDAALCATPWEPRVPKPPGETALGQENVPRKRIFFLISLFLKTLSLLSRE